MEFSLFGFSLFTLHAFPFHPPGHLELTSPSPHNHVLHRDTNNSRTEHRLTEKWSVKKKIPVSTSLLFLISPADPIGISGKNWHGTKKAFRPNAGLTSYAKRQELRKHQDAVKELEREMKAEREAERQVCRSFLFLSLLSHFVRVCPVPMCGSVWSPYWIQVSILGGSILGSAPYGSL